MPRLPWVKMLCEHRFEYQDFQMNQTLGDRVDDTVEAYFYSILEFKNTFLCWATQGDDCELGFPD